MTAIMEGRSGIRHLLHRLVLWRVKWYWYLIVLVGIPVIRNIGVLALPGGLATYRPGVLGSALLLSLSVLPLTILVSGLAEEPGTFF